LRYHGRVYVTNATTSLGARLRPHLPLLLILLLALGWRLLLWAQPLHPPANDEVEYIAVARDLLAGRGWVFYESWRWLRAPLYPLFLAGSLWLAGGDLQWAALPNVLLSVGVVALVYRLARELAPRAGRRPALIAAAAAALLQTYGTFASLYMSETLFSALFAGTLLACARWRRTGRLGWAGAAGLLFGMACLTRSAALVFLPAALLWMAGVDWARTGRLRVRAALPGLLMTLCAALLIAPWTLRNCRAYGECILIESGFSYNLWAFYEPRESLDEINAALEAIPNPAERADEASRRGLERLREDPSILLRKLPAEWERLWVIKPIPDRFRLASAYSDPPPALFLSALLLDDLLYLLVLCAAASGMALLLSRRDALAVLMLLWIGVFVGATLLTHAEGRYRHFLFMVLIPLAGVAVDALLRRQWPRPAWAAAAGAALGLALLPLFAYYPWAWAAGGLPRALSGAGAHAGLELPLLAARAGERNRPGRRARLWLCHRSLHHRGAAGGHRALERRAGAPTTRRRGRPGARHALGGGATPRWRDGAAAGLRRRPLRGADARAGLAPGAGSAAGSGRDRAAQPDLPCA
jgi:4-amino-4-deoxy-L-arabinose transferase-like glycosyltransferase